MVKKEQKTILVVEDEILIAVEEARQLENEGYRVICVHNGEKAIDIVCRKNEPVDLILMDVDLGKDPDGAETALEILKTHDIPIIFLSSHTEKEFVQKSEKISSYGYVIKNCGTAVLNSSIKMAFRLFESKMNEKKKEETIRKCMERYKALVENINDIVYSYSTTKGATYWSPRVESILGISVNDLINDPQKWHNAIHPDDISRVDAVIKEFVEEKPFSIEYRIKDTKGKWHWFLDQSIGRRIQDDEIIIEGTASDITERKRMEEIIQNNEKRFRAIVENSSDAITLLNAEGKVLYESSNVPHITGNEVRERIGRSGFETVYSEDLPAIKETFKCILSEPGKQMRNIQFRAVHPDGTVWWAEGSAMNMLHDPNVEAIIVNYRDITERKKDEEKIKNLLNEKELILKEVHHRIKNNMSVMNSLLHLQSNMQNNPEVKNILSDAAGRIRSMMILYDKLYRSDNNKTVSVKEYFPSLINDIISIFPPKKVIKTEICIDDIVLCTDILTPLGIIINELITNSMKYAFGDRNDGIISLTVSKNENCISIIFEDNGAGIPESVSFENSEEFGLYLVGVLVNQINGSIKIEKQNGTRIIIEFKI